MNFVYLFSRYFLRHVKTSNIDVIISVLEFCLWYVCFFDGKPDRRWIKIFTNFAMKQNQNLGKKQIELIKHTFTNKLASTLTHARYGGCRCPRRQGIIYRRVIWSRKVIQSETQRILVKDVIRTTIIIRIIEGIQRIKYILRPNEIKSNL